MVSANCLSVASIAVQSKHSPCPSGQFQFCRQRGQYPTMRAPVASAVSCIAEFPLMDFMVLTFFQFKIIAYKVKTNGRFIYVSKFNRVIFYEVASRLNLTL